MLVNHHILPLISVLALTCALSACGGGGGGGGESNADSSPKETSPVPIEPDQSIKQFYCENTSSTFSANITQVDQQQNFTLDLNAKFPPAQSAQPGLQGIKAPIEPVHITHEPATLNNDNKSENRTPCEDAEFCAMQRASIDTVFPDTYACGEFITIRAQDMTLSQFGYACQLLRAQETHFHTLLNTANLPVADDYNESLEIFVFDDASEYQHHGSTLFGIDPNNGGMFVEGTPSTWGNQARLFAYESDWLRPAFEIWNLTHEYSHYLDARFNLKGGFADSLTGTHKTVWWIEGLAEYVSKKNHNSKAISAARTRAYRLSEVLANTYDHDSKRLYRWGYLAVRYMFERYPSHIEQILMYFRNGDFDSYLDFIDNTIGTHYDSDWYHWLGEVQSHSGEPVGLKNAHPVIARNQEGGDLYYTIDVPADKSLLKITLEGGSGNANLYVRHGEQPTDLEYDCRSAGNNNSESCEILSPDEGLWYIRLKTYNPYAGVTLKATYDLDDSQGSGFQPNQLTNGEQVDGISALSQCDNLVYFIDVPQNAKNLRFTTVNGAGDADLYVKQGAAPSSQAYDCKSVQADSRETCSIDKPAAGRWYLKLNANSVFTDLSLIASFDSD